MKKNAPIEIHALRLPLLVRLPARRGPAAARADGARRPARRTGTTGAQRPHPLNGD